MCTIHNLINYLQIEPSKITEEYFNVYSKTSINYTIRSLFTGYDPVLNLRDYEDKYDNLFKTHRETASYFLDAYVSQNIINDAFFEKYKQYIDKVSYAITSLDKLSPFIISIFIRHEHYKKQPDLLFRLLCFLLNTNMTTEFESVFTKYSHLLENNTTKSLCEYALLLGRILPLSLILEKGIDSNPFKLKHMTFYVMHTNYSKHFQSVNYDICFLLVENKGFNFKYKHFSNWIHYSKKNLLGFVYPTIEFLLSKLFKEKPTVNEIISKFSLYVKSKDLMKIILNNYNHKELLSRLHYSTY
jgi:hypothetical protein